MSDDESLTDKTHTFLKQLGIEPTQIIRIQAGRNSRVWRVSTRKGHLALKEYFRHPQDPRDRLAAEAGFLRLLNRHTSLRVPQVIAVDEERDLGLYSWLEGKPVEKIKIQYLEQCVAFIAALNQCRQLEDAKQIALASEACFTVQEHLGSVQKRVQLLLEIDVHSRMHDKTLNWIRNFLEPKLKQLQTELEKREVQTENHLHLREPVLSPSDFGFHNIIEHKGELGFFDFEYAGWDDPAKLCCDFACQPQRPVTTKQAKLFCQLIGKSMKEANLSKMFEILLPIYRIKWCCIMLNEFRMTEWARRIHAGEKDSEQRLKSQFIKTQSYFHQHIEATDPV